MTAAFFYVVSALLVSFLGVGRLNAADTSPPFIYGITGGGLVEFGEERILRVTLSGETEGFRYAWARNGAVIEGAVTDRLTVVGGTPEGSTTYSVEVTNSIGSSAASVSVTVLSAAAPVVRTSPASISAYRDQNVSFGVVVTGSFPRTYQWFKNGVLIEGARSAVLMLSRISNADSAIYHVTVSNSLGSVTSQPASLTVNAPVAPVLQSIAPYDADSVEGQDLTLNFYLDLGSAPFVVQWYKNGSLLPVTTPSLTFSSLSRSDEGEYHVVVSNAAGSATSRKAKVTVRAASLPVFQQQPQSVSVVEGQDASFSGYATSNAPVTYQWMFNGLPIVAATQNYFSLRSVKPQDAGRYTLVATTRAGSVTSSTANLTVTPPIPPALASQPMDTVRSIGDSVTFSTSITGSSPMTLQWFFNNRPIPGANSSQLYIYRLGVIDAGKYHLEVKNGGGTVVSRQAELIVERGQRPLVLTLTSTTAMIGSPARFYTSYGWSSSHRFQWYRNGKPIAGATSSDLYLEKVTEEDFGEYFVVVSNEYGSTASRTAFLSQQISDRAPVGSALQVDRVGDIAYFLFANPARIERFNLATDSWLAPLILSRTPNAMAASSTALFVGFGRTVSRFDLNGNGETQFGSALAGDINALAVLPTVLLIDSGTSPSTLNSYSLATGAALFSISGHYGLSSSLTAAPGLGRVFSRNSVYSPGGVTSILVSPTGEFGGIQTSRYLEGNFGGRRSTLSADGRRLMDGSGIVYSTTDLSYVGTFGMSHHDATDMGGGEVLVLRGKELVSYDANFAEKARVTLTHSGEWVMVRGNDAFVFGTPVSGGGIPKMKVSLLTLIPRSTLPPVDAHNVGFFPDEVVTDRNGTVFLYSRLTGNVFRWSTTTRTYLSPIVLQGRPS
ncbi:MAG TPA: immunoglobulin domain-containing protein, partial [Opitutaceae bacterium]|nr:immunoglobulin domain-containing protein [Opitutaceae bacterium]